MEGVIEMDYMEVVPAYGVDYKNQREVKEAWNSNKDFRDTVSGRYLSKREMDFSFPNTKVIVRYAKQMKVVGVN